MRSVLLTTMTACVLLGRVAAAQPPPPPGPPPPHGPPPPAVRVFVDCHGGCDSTYIRSELNFVDHVRDREVADVHLLITTKGTGGGGTEYTISFIGLRRFEAIQEKLIYATQPGDTDDEIRRGLVRTLKLGLVRYMLQTPLRGSLDVSFRPPRERPEASGQTTDDPWNFWVYRVRGNLYTSGEESSTSVYLSGAASASRVTEAWKSSVNLGLNYRQNTYKFDEEDGEEAEEDYTSITRDSSASATLIKTLGGHWGAGLRVSLSSSTYTNQAHTFRVSPAVEYNIFPYAETTRRQLTVRYSMGLNRLNYREITIYEKMNETLMSHALAVNMDMRQPWGTLDVQVGASQYLPDSSKNRLSIEGDLEVRLFKGFSLDVGAGTSFIRDQIYLPAGEATQAEILLRQRQIATSYDYGFSVGFSYTFGSVYNNVVNSRLSGF